MAATTQVAVAITSATFMLKRPEKTAPSENPIVAQAAITDTKTSQGGILGMPSIIAAALGHEWAAYAT